MRSRLNLRCITFCLLISSGTVWAHSNDHTKIWDLEILKSMKFSGGIDAALHDRKPALYENMYVFGDSFSDSGNLFGTRFIPNQWPFPLGSGVNVYAEPLAVIFTHKVPWPVFDNQSFPTARMASGLFNIRQRLDWFLGPNLFSQHVYDYKQKELFIFWGGFNDAKAFIRHEQANSPYRLPNFIPEVERYVAGINRVSSRDGDVIVMNIPDTLAFPGGRLSGRSTPLALGFRVLSQWLHLDFNQSNSLAYLEKLHRGTGVAGLEHLIQRDLADFKRKFWFIDPALIDHFAANYYQLQLDTVNTLNQQLYTTLKEKAQGNILYADMRSFVRELIDNPSYLGFDNVQSPECGPYSAANACHTHPADKRYYYLFGDDFNFSFKAQKEIFSYLSMLLATPFVLGGIYNSFLSTNIDINTGVVNGAAVKLGNLAAKPSLTLVYNRQWNYKDIVTYGYNLGFRVMNYRVPFTDLWVATSYFSPYITHQFGDYLSLGLENQTSVSYYEARREVSFEGREPMSLKDRYEKANLSGEKFLVAGTMHWHYDNDWLKASLKLLFGPGYALNHRYEDRTQTSTSVSFMPNNLFYLHGEGKLNLELKKFPTEQLRLGIEAQAQYNQSLTPLKLRGNTKHAPVQFRRKIKLITNYEGEWAVYLKYQASKRTTWRYGYQGRNYNYLIRQGVFVEIQNQFD
ncbi:MAG: hypothetical protein WDW20_02730 [Neisseriaceae bacterium]